MIAGWGEDEIRLTESVSVLRGASEGTYPSGNSVLVRGSAEAVIIDPSITVVERGGAPCPIDAVINSHSHEDHMAGNGLFPAARVHIHHEDLGGAQSLDGLMDVYGFSDSLASEFGRIVTEEFHYAPRPDAVGFHDGHRFDLGGITVEAVHLPGHTRGHSGFRISGGVFFLADIDLTGFGPYYGDMWSDLEDFEESLNRVRDEEADWYVTFHHRGIIEGRDQFLEHLERFRSVIDRRHRAMLDFLWEPHTVDEMVAHRFIYRPHVEIPIVEPVERRSAELHLQRMIARAEVTEVDPGRFQSVL
jgi:glyoxylase-like metal-dependent hydrolase (beta-lactamase superfamily II)